MAADDGEGGDTSADETPSGGSDSRGLQSLIHFATSLPGALLLTGFLMERFGVLGIVERMALAFREVSADFWTAVFWLVPFSIDYDPDILSTYALLVVPLLAEMYRGGLLRDRSRTDLYYYMTGLVAVFLIVSGYGAWGFIGDIYRVVGGMILTILLFTLIYLPFYLLGIAIFGYYANAILFAIAGYGFLLLWVVLWFLDVSLIGLIEGSFLPAWLRNLLVGVLELYSWQTMWSFLFALFTLVVLLAAPLTRAPLFVVAWVGVFFAANWFDAHVRPSVDDYLERLENSFCVDCRDAPGPLTWAENHGGDGCSRGSIRG